MMLKGNITEKIKGAGDWIGSFISRNGHAQQAIPAQHRLSSITGMFLGWMGGDKVRDALFAKNQTSEGNYEDLKKEDVPFILRPIYHKIEWNPHSEEPGEKWKKLLHQTLPAITAAAGTMAGSELIFQLNGRSAAFKQTMNDIKNGKPVSPFDAESATQHGQSRIPTWLAAVSAGAAASSTIPTAFSAALSWRFAAANAGKINLTNSIGGNLGAKKALSERMEKIIFYVKSADKSGGKIDKQWSETFVEQALGSMYAKVLQVPREKERATRIIHDTFQNVFDKYQQQGLSGEKLMYAVSNDMKNIMGFIKPTLNEKGKVEFHGIDKFVREKLGYKFSNIVFGNAIPELRMANETFTKTTGIGKKYSAEHIQEYISNQERNAADSTPGRA